MTRTTLPLGARRRIGHRVAASAGIDLVLATATSAAAGTASGPQGRDGIPFVPTQVVYRAATTSMTGSNVVDGSITGTDLTNNTVAGQRPA